MPRFFTHHSNDGDQAGPAVCPASALPRLGPCSTKGMLAGLLLLGQLGSAGCTFGYVSQSFTLGADTSSGEGGQSAESDDAGDVANSEADATATASDAGSESAAMTGAGDAGMSSVGESGSDSGDDSDLDCAAACATWAQTQWLTCVDGADVGGCIEGVIELYFRCRWGCDVDQQGDDLDCTAACESHVVGARELCTALDLPAGDCPKLVERLGELCRDKCPGAEEDSGGDEGGDCKANCRIQAKQAFNSCLESGQSEAECQALSDKKLDSCLEACGE